MAHRAPRPSGRLHPTNLERTVRLLRAAVLVVVAVLAIGIPDAHAASCRVAGHVTTTGGAPIGGVWVSATGAGNGQSGGFAVTDANGNYSMTLSTADTRYRVRFAHPTQAFAAVYHPGTLVTATATTFDWVDGTTWTADQTLQVSGSLSGTVTRSGAGAAGANVWLYDAAGTWVYSTTTNASGAYSFTRLLPQTYRLQVWSPTSAFPARWWSSGATFAEGADLVVAPGGALTGVSLDVTPPARVTGHVTDALAGTPIANIRVWLYLSSGVLANVAYTDASGAYAFNDVADGDYQLMFSDPASVYARGAWWPDSPDRSSATTLHLVHGSTPVADVALYRPADQPIPPYAGLGTQKVVVIGDSITQMSTTALHTALDPVAQVSVVGINNQRFDQMQPVAARFAATAPDQVIINLGTNDAGQNRPLADIEQSVDAMLATFPTATCITLVTPADATGLAAYNLGVGPLIEYLRSRPSADPRVQVADWARLLAAHLAAGEPGGGWTLDTVHPNALGQQQYGALARAAVDACGAPAATLSGTAYTDLDADGSRDPEDPPLVGATVSVVGQDVLSAAVDRPVTTGADGTWSVSDLRAGTYDLILAETVGSSSPASAVGTLGGTPTHDGIGGVVVAPGAAGTGYDFGTTPDPGSLAGVAFADIDLDGIRDTGDPGIAGVTIELTGVDLAGAPVPATSVVTGDDGAWSFTALRPGTYHLTARSPYGHSPSGVLVGDLGGVADVDHITGILVPPDGHGSGYGFGARLPDAVRWRQAGKGGGAGLGRGVTVGPDGSTTVVGLFTGSLTLGTTPATATLTSAGDTDVYVARYDTNGVLQWARRAGGPGADEGDDVAVDPTDGAVTVVGGLHGAATFASSGGDVVVDGGPAAGFAARYDTTGALSWARTFSAPTAVAAGVGVGADGASFVTGWYAGADLDVAGVATVHRQGPTEGFVVRLEADGSVTWAQGLHSPAAILPFDVAVRPDGAPVVAGGHAGITVGTSTLPTQGGLDTFVLALDVDGNPQALRSFGAAGTDAALGVAVDPTTGDTYLSGVFSGSVYFGGPMRSSAGGTDTFVLALDADGATRWVQTAGSTDGDIGTRVAVAGNHVYSAGSLAGSASFGGVPVAGLGGQDAFAVSYGTDGAFEWVRRVAGTGAESGWGIAADADGASFTGGYQFSSQLLAGPSQVPLPSTVFPQAFVVRLNP